MDESKSLGDFQEEYDDIPDTEDVEQSLETGVAQRYRYVVRKANRMAKQLQRPALLAGLCSSLYIVFVKLPGVLFSLDIWFLSSFFDPVVAVLLTLYSILWSANGLIQVIGGIAFLKLRQVQNSSPVRALIHLSKGGVVVMTGITLLIIMYYYVTLG